MGDFNVNLNKTNKTETRKTLDWGRELGLENIYLNTMGQTNTEQQAFVSDTANESELINTWYKSEKISDSENSTTETIPKGHLDHVWVSSDLVARGCITGYSVANHQVANSDHRPVTITVNMHEMLGITNYSYPVEELPKRT